MARNQPVVGDLPGESAAERGYDGVNRVAPAVSHHYTAMRVGDLNMSRQPCHDRPPGPQALRLQPSALRLLVVLVRQPQPFQRRSRTCFYDNTAGGAETAV